MTAHSSNHKQKASARWLSKQPMWLQVTIVLPIALLLWPFVVRPTTYIGVIFAIICALLASALTPYGMGQ